MTDPNRPCPVCGVQAPAHDWDVHERRTVVWEPPAETTAPDLRAAGTMLARSDTRGTVRVRVLAVHTTEGILRAADLRAWASWPGSSHACADADGQLLTPAEGFVPYERAAWTLRSGNPWSENIELCGFARWTAAEWLNRPRLLDGCARWLAARSLARGIPLVRLTPAQYRAGGSGVIDHYTHTVGYSDGTHTDAGPGFPWDAVLGMARDYAATTTGRGALMALTDAEQKELLAHVRQLVREANGPDYLAPPLGRGVAGWPTSDGKRRTVVAMLGEVWTAVGKLQADVAKLLAR